MSKYSRLITMKDNFTKAAIEAVSNFMKLYWQNKADAIQNEIDNMTISEAQEKMSC